MKLTFLAGDCPLTKTFALQPDGTLEKTSYPFVAEFTSHDEIVHTTAELFDALRKHADLGHCLLKGTLRRPLVNESRAGSTSGSDPSQWIVFDLDGIDVPDVETFIARVLPAEFHDASYVLQWSASQGIDANPALRCHVFFLMSSLYQPEQAKQWLTHLNLTSDILRNGVTLTASAMALRFPLDRTVVQNDKLIYIAPPVCVGVNDHLQGKRIEHIVKANDLVTFAIPVLHTAVLDEAQSSRIAELREELGLPVRKAKYKFVENVGNVCKNPNVATVTGERRARGFVYLNLNGGNSFAYYYPEARPHYLYNFKGEPVYVMADILPDYWERIRQPAPGAEGARVPFAFRHLPTDTYFNGIYDAAADSIVEIASTSGGKKISDFFIQNNAVAPDVIPDWTYEFRPHSDVVFDAEARFCNRFERTQYLRAARPGGSVPRTVGRLLDSILAGDAQCRAHFINWLAWIFQHRDKTGTAWVFHGVEGTGKGVFYSHVLMPLFGEKYCVIKQLKDLDDKFNAELETNLIFVLDEARLASQTNAAKTLNQIKSMVTEPFLNMRAMRANSVQIRNYSNFLFYSNDYDALNISATDRRFNVAPRQEERLLLRAEDIASIRDELDLFASYLIGYKTDEQMAKTALTNEAKQEMRHASQDAFEQICQAIMDGNLQYFAMFLHAEAKELHNIMKHTAYKATVKEWFLNANNPMFVTEAQINAVFTYLIAPDSGFAPQQFARRLAHKNMPLKESDGRQRGRMVTWRLSPEQRAVWAKDLDAAPELRAVK